MSEYPDEIFEARETENLPGIIYDLADKKNMFSEDFQNLGAEITAIETLLGVLASWDSATLAERVKGIKSLSDAVQSLLVVKGRFLGVGTETPTGNFSTGLDIHGGDNPNVGVHFHSDETGDDEAHGSSVYTDGDTLFISNFVGSYITFLINSIEAIDINGDGSVSIQTYLELIAGASGQFFNPSGRLNRQISAVGVGNGADTTNDVLFTFSVPLNTLSYNGASLRIFAYGKTGANTNNKRIRLTFAGSEIFTTNTITSNNIDYILEADITRIDATHVSCAVKLGRSGANVLTSVVPNLAVADLTSNASVLALTGASLTSGVANDVIGYGMLTEFIQ